MEADPQDCDVGLYGLGTIVMSDDLVLMVGRDGGGFIPAVKARVVA
jgi:hypothetical protein